MTSPNNSPVQARNPRTITARNPDDLLASVPVLLGFTPQESIVMLTLGPAPSFHARIDLPRTRKDRAQVIEMLLEPVLTHGVKRVALVVYSAFAKGVRTLTEELCAAFEGRDIYVVDALHADGERWFPALPGFGSGHSGVPYDDRNNPISVQAVFDGQLMYASREALAGSLRSEESVVTTVTAHLKPVRTLLRKQLPAEAAWATALVRRHIEEGSPPDAVDTARLLQALNVVRIRDAVWCLMTPETAKSLVDFWTDIVRRSPVSLLAAPATLLAFAAWLSGRGALAWCALDRARESDPDYSLAQLLAHMLDRAVPPAAWVPPTELISDLLPGAATQLGPDLA